MRIATFNLNGIRAAEKRGFAAWLADRSCDVLALQEVRAQAAQIPSGIFGSYHQVADLGSLPGRNGVAILSKSPIAQLRTWSGSAWQLSDGEPQTLECDSWPVLPETLEPFRVEGRYIEADLADRNLTVACLYLPKGGLPEHLQNGKGREKPDGGAKYQRKMRFLSGFQEFLTQTISHAQDAGKEFILLGDFNIAHENIDLKNWKTNQKSEGFLPEERAWFDELLDKQPLQDVVRKLHPDTPGPYSWWSWRGQAFTNDAGWRIDYHLASPTLAERAQVGGTDKAPTYETRVSDHAPVIVDYLD